MNKINKTHILVKKFLEEHSVVESNILSFNDFIDNRLHQIAQEVSKNIASEEIKIEIGKIRVEKPEIIEADGSKHPLLPAEARLRNLTYSAPIFIELNIKTNGESEHAEVEIGRIPIMVKSKYCHLHNLTKEQLIENNIDPADSGGYFIINGNERVLVLLEDLAPNMPFILKDAKGNSVLRVLSQRGAYRIPTNISESSDGLIEVNFSRFKNIPAIPLIKALGIFKDADIADLIGIENNSFVVNMYEYADLHTPSESLNYLIEKVGMQGAKKEALDKLKSRIDSYFLPHIGVDEKSRIEKALTLCKLIKQFYIVNEKNLITDKDHYENKRVKLSGDLFSDLFRVNLTILLRDIQHSLQRLSKRKKLYSIKTLAKSTLFTHRIESAIATGSWIGEKTGVTQNMDKTNYLAILSKLQYIVSLLPSEQENFKARTLHPTQYGRFCPIETPEGTSIGLRKNLALMAKISTAVKMDNEEFIKILEENGMRRLNK